MAYGSNLSAWEDKAGLLRAGGQSRLHREFQATVRPSLKKGKNKNKNGGWRAWYHMPLILAKQRQADLYEKKASLVYGWSSRPVKVTDL